MTPVVFGDVFTDLLVIDHQHQLDILGLRQNVPFLLQVEQIERSEVRCQPPGGLM